MFAILIEVRDAIGIPHDEEITITAVIWVDTHYPDSEDYVVLTAPYLIDREEVQTHSGE